MIPDFRFPMAGFVAIAGSWYRCCSIWALQSINCLERGEGEKQVAVQVCQSFTGSNPGLPQTNKPNPDIGAGIIWLGWAWRRARASVVHSFAVTSGGFVTLRHKKENESIYSIRGMTASPHYFGLPSSLRCCKIAIISRHNTNTQYAVPIPIATETER